MRWILSTCLALTACSGGAASTTSKGDAGSHNADSSVGPVKVTDAGLAADAPRGSPDASPAVAPLVVPANQWTWTDIPGAACADGTQTGFAVNPAASASKDVLIFLEGGGACWDGTSCWGPVSTSFYVATGYGQAAFATDPQVAAIYLLDRTNASNPFADKNIVYVPYCTGDVFSGSRVTSLDYLGISHETHFVGYENLTIYLRYVAATFPDAERVWLAGDSAGGFGAALNFEHVQNALPGTRVDVLDDSGQPIQPGPGLWTTWMTAWNMQLPAGCSTCATGPGALADYYTTKYPSQRFGLISYAHDTVISPFMGLTLGQFNTELLALAAHMDASWTDGHYFIIPGASHVGLLAPTPALTAWVRAMVSDDPSWASVKP